MDTWILEQIMGNNPEIIHFETWVWSWSWTWKAYWTRGHLLWTVLIFHQLAWILAMCECILRKLHFMSVNLVLTCSIMSVPLIAKHEENWKEW